MKILHAELLPIDGVSFVFWGGETKEQNYHIENRAQRHAFDFTGMHQPTLRYRGDGTKNEDYFIFDRPIIAPLDGVVIEAVDGIRDNQPKKMHQYMIFGNSLIVQHDVSIFSVFAHLKCGSVSVRPGDHIKTGAHIARCGNSGRSSEPHLHFHAQSTDDVNDADGLRCVFKRIRVDHSFREDYSPVRLDIVENIKG